MKMTRPREYTLTEWKTFSAKKRFFLILDYYQDDVGPLMSVRNIKKWVRVIEKEAVQKQGCSR
jgi:hypothetical protein